MTRDDIRKAFPEATDEQINQLLNIHSADIGKAKGDAAKLQGDLKAAQDALATANATIADGEEQGRRGRAAEADRRLQGRRRGP